MKYRTTKLYADDSKPICEMRSNRHPYIRARRPFSCGKPQKGSEPVANAARHRERSPIEAEQIIGDMMRRASSFSLPDPILPTAHAHLTSYELRRSQDIKA
jgi:hypothetical protein